MKRSARTARPKQLGVLDYPTLTLPQIRALPVERLAEPEGAHLYLWTPQRFLPEALSMVREWGFRYHCLLTWVKPSGMTPFSWMFNAEHVVFARRGNLPLSRMGLKLAFAASVGRSHSTKPEHFYDLVRKASPGPRIDLFARAAHEGFEAWGDEAPRRDPPLPGPR